MYRIIFTNKSSLFSAFLGIIIGTILLFLPQLTGLIAVRLIAIILLAFAINYLFKYYQAKKNNYNGYGYLISGIIALGFGLYIWIFPQYIISFIPFIVGIILLINGIVAIPLAIDLVKEGNMWITALLTSGLPLLAGIFLMFNPYGVANFAIRILGLILLVNGITNLVTIRKFKKMFE